MNSILLRYRARRLLRDLGAGLFGLCRVLLALACAAAALPFLLVLVVAGVLLVVCVVCAALAAPSAPKKPAPGPLGGRLDATILRAEGEA